MHVGSDPGACLLLLVEILEPPALDRRDVGLNPGLDPLTALPAQEPRQPAATVITAVEAAVVRAALPPDVEPTRPWEEAQAAATATAATTAASPSRRTEGVMGAQGEEEREVGEIGHERKVRKVHRWVTEAATGRRHHDRDRQPAYGERDAQQHHGDGARRGDRRLDGPDGEGEHEGDAHVERGPLGAARGTSRSSQTSPPRAGDSEVVTEPSLPSDPWRWHDDDVIRTVT